ncbi:MAG TPA: protein kinase [Lacunisphaera sp.]|nr:protein kinase [Lacunisphaera sp.]
MYDSHGHEERIFAEALALPSGERPRFLAEACGGDADLRQRVESLLEALDSLGGFMADSPAGHPAPAARAVTPVAGETRGTKIGHYKLLQKIGEGGCGVVWMAEQEEPVRRRVALKIIKLGMDTREVVARFEAERQALAMMDHNNIAKVFDAGATEAGRPYFVMELVRGIRITNYCDENNLPTAARLELFTQVCHAVQHAHQKGVIHRDLKPSNILITVHDGEPVPKVIDFGIAKATQGRLTDRTLFTAFEQFIGTPVYMSPEQAELSGVDIDTRSDIYSLGVLLYELLTGRPPFDPKSLVQAGIDEIRRIIREVDPPRPSTRLATLTDADRATVARLRHTAPARLTTVLRGDLDWIVMKALEKNRTRRYDTADSLALDLVRYLHNEPVTARPPSRVYCFGKLVRRHQVLFGAAAAVGLALVAGTVISTWQAVRAARAEQAAALERNRAVKERARAEEMLAFMLGDLRTQLAKVGRLDVLDSVGEQAMAYFASQDPQDLSDTALARLAKALMQIGEVRMSQARYAEADAAFAEAYRRAAALVARHPRDGAMLFERGQAEYWNGFVRWKRGELAAATDWLARYRDTGIALVALDSARPDWQRELAYGHHNLAVLDKEHGRFTEARAGFLAELATLEKMSAANRDDLELRFNVADIHSWLGGLAMQQGDLAEALAQYVTQTTQLEQLTRQEPKTARWRFKLADALLFQTDILLATGRSGGARDRLGAARQLLDELAALDPANRRWETARLHAGLFAPLVAWQQGDLPEATRLLGEVRPQLEKLAAMVPADRVIANWVTKTWRMEAQLRLAAGRPDAAGAAIQAVGLAEKIIGEGLASDADAGECMQTLVVAGETAAAAGDLATAQRHWQRALTLFAERAPGTRDWRLLEPAARAAARLGRASQANGIIAQLKSFGYIPLEPWPAADPRGADQH